MAHQWRAVLGIPFRKGDGRPDFEPEDVPEPGMCKHGWQHKMNVDVKLDFKRLLMPSFSRTVTVHIKSQSGLGVSGFLLRCPLVH